MQFAEFTIQLKENRGKSAMLGALTLVLVVFVIKALMGGAPKIVMGAPLGHLGDVGSGAATDTGDDAAQRVAASSALWAVLKEKRGLSPGEAFYFDPSFYSLDPNSKTAHDAAATELAATPRTVAEKLVPKPTDGMGEASRAALIAQVSVSAKGLTLQSTVLTTPPSAVVNSGIYHINDTVDGFKLIDIRARQVIVEKNGVTLAIEMAN